MIEHSLPKEALDVVEAYWDLKVNENKSVRCPYFRNPTNGKYKWGLTAYSGKGSSKEIEEELKIIEKLEGRNFSQMQESEIRDIMKKRKLGIECSGFIIRILDGAIREFYKKPIYSLLKFNAGALGRLFSRMRPYTHIDVATLVHPDNARPLDNVNDIMPGDILRFNSKVDHIIIVTATKRSEDFHLKNIEYVHSILENSNEGIKKGKIDFINPDKDLLHQEWSEEPYTGRTISDSGMPKIYRLFVIQDMHT